MKISNSNEVFYTTQTFIQWWGGIKWHYCFGKLAISTNPKCMPTPGLRNSTVHAQIHKKTQTFRAGLAKTPKNWKQPKCPSIQAWKNCGFFLKWKTNINQKEQINSTHNRDGSHKQYNEWEKPDTKGIWWIYMMFKHRHNLCGSPLSGVQSLERGRRYLRGQLECSTSRSGWRVHGWLHTCIITEM